jgi:serine protease DegQ
MLDSGSSDQSASQMARASLPRTALAVAPPAGDGRSDTSPLSQGEVASMRPFLRAVVRLRISKDGPPPSPDRTGQDASGQPRSSLQARSDHGFLVDGQGYIVTSDRVVSDARLIEVSLYDGRNFPASLIAQDPLNDVAILKVPGTDLPTIVLGESREVAVGEQVLVTGATPGADRALATATVRATGRATGGNLAVDLSSRPEAWGGPLLNRHGHAIGVLTSDARPAGAAGSMIFAVPIDRVKAVLRSVLPTSIVAEPKVPDR